MRGLYRSCVYEQTVRVDLITFRKASKSIHTNILELCYNIPTYKDVTQKYLHMPLVMGKLPNVAYYSSLLSIYNNLMLMFICFYTVAIN